MPDTNALEQAKRGTADAPVHDLILSRWSPRSFADKPVSDADLKTIFSAAAWAASSYNEQPWRFLVGRKGDETYTKIFNSLAPPNQAWAGSAPVLYCSFGKKTFSANGQPNGYGLHDTGAASATISLQAQELGLHTHGMGGFDKETLRAFFGVPSDFDAGACWALGYLGDPQNVPEDFKAAELAPRTRKPLSEFVFSDWEKPAAL
ncbi:nitroreductase [Terriglobus roseus DSM 18391]|uniref:Nitroreductase n=1 Tax=Terriglobus roseus (strain DSM 18391 / NRRL B-41598 / KBS 63) TaxID=926566 RepID=I3ZIE3_TERRK|nr:nitroreductase family protein [Terriglobus roseus]AFL89011.1 nitroreductase [Terriglobus roseus DSM 18391]